MRFFEQALLQRLVQAAQQAPFYKLWAIKQGIDWQAIRTGEDFAGLPLLDERELALAYPNGVQAVGQEKLLQLAVWQDGQGRRQAATYTRRDLDDLALMAQRCLEMAGIGPGSRVMQLEAGDPVSQAAWGRACQQAGALAVPAGEGLEQALENLSDFSVDCLIASPQKALELARFFAGWQMMELPVAKMLLTSALPPSQEEARLLGEGRKLVWAMQLPAAYGPAFGCQCGACEGMHCWDDYFYWEFVNPESGRPVPEGQEGELVVTTLRREAAPLLRYRTGLVSRALPGENGCASAFGRIALPRQAQGDAPPAGKAPDARPE